MKKRKTIQIELTGMQALLVKSLISAREFYKGREPEDNQVYQQICKETREKIAHNQKVHRLETEKKLAEDKLHNLFSMMEASRKRGNQRTVHFPPITRMSGVWRSSGGIQLNNKFRSPTKAKFYRYQPRKRLVWLQFEVGDIIDNYYDHELHPFRLAEAVMLGFMSEETFNLKTETI